MNTQTLPQTDSIAELARFWDTHDLTDFEAELEEVSEPVFERSPKDTVRVQFRPQEIEMLERLAAAQDMELTALIRRWVLERLAAHGNLPANGSYVHAD
jgi:hypothetical protein